MIERALEKRRELDHVSTIERVLRPFACKLTTQGINRRKY